MTKPVAVTQRARQMRNARQRDDAKWFRILTLPWLVGFVTLSLVPLIAGLVISLTNYNGVNPGSARFIGLANYERAFMDPNVAVAAQRTAAFVLAYVPLNFVVAMSLALLVNAAPRARGSFRSLYYLPSVIPVVGAAFIWRALLNRDSGVVNEVARMINPTWGIAWLGDYATESLVSLTLWLGLGFSTVLYIAALQNVPLELIQSSRVDGANYLQRLRFVVLPLISPVIFYQILLALVFALGVTVEPSLLAGRSEAGPASIPNDNVLLTVYIYQQMFSAQRFGYASALLWITFVASVFVTLALFLTRKKWVHSESGNI